MYEFWHDEGDDFEKLPHAITHQWDWVETESPEQQIDRALKWIQDSYHKKEAVGEGKQQSNEISY